MESNNLNAELLKRKEQEDEDEVKWSRKVLDEMKKLWIVAGPAIFSRFSVFGIFVISQAFVGHIGAVELAAYALSQTVLLRLANGVLVSNFFTFLVLCITILTSTDKNYMCSWACQVHLKPYVGKHMVRSNTTC